MWELVESRTCPSCLSLSLILAWGLSSSQPSSCKVLGAICLTRRPPTSSAPSAAWEGTGHSAVLGESFLKVQASLGRTVPPGGKPLSSQRLVERVAEAHRASLAPSWRKLEAQAVRGPRGGGRQVPHVLPQLRLPAEQGLFRRHRLSSLASAFFQEFPPLPSHRLGTHPVLTDFHDFKAASSCSRVPRGWKVPNQPPIWLLLLLGSLETLAPPEAWLPRPHILPSVTLSSSPRTPVPRARGPCRVTEAHCPL